MSENGRNQWPSTREVNGRQLTWGEGVREQLGGVHGVQSVVSGIFEAFAGALSDDELVTGEVDGKECVGSVLGASNTKCELVDEVHVCQP